jgi:CO/xanthine dehydrogenase FAD-binding subunit
MIPFDFEYYKPDTIEEATKLFRSLMNQGKEPIYYGGGTEIITLARAFEIRTDAVIDIKGIPDCHVHDILGNVLVIGSAVTLTEISEKNLFPFLSKTVKRIADHTIQDKITLGGNMAGTIIYAESTLPLFVANAEVTVAGLEGIRRITMDELYDKGIKLNKGDLIVQVMVNTRFLSLPYVHVKRTKNDKIGYPLITIGALKDNNRIRYAFSGLCSFPFHSQTIEDILNRQNCDLNSKLDEAIRNLPDFIISDTTGSNDYRRFMFHRMVIQTMNDLSEVN